MDTLLFTPKAPSYDASYTHSKRRLIAIRGELANRRTTAYVPCIVSPAAGPTNVLVVHFHGTGGDIAKSGPWFDIQKHINVHVIAVEYPGYGAFPGYCASDSSPMPASEQSVTDVARLVMRHVLTVWQWPVEQVLVSGRSMGSGPACVVAAEFQPGALAVLSGFASLRDVAAAKLKVPLLGQLLVRERFHNETRLRQFLGHAIVLHGRRDPLITCGHADRNYAALERAATRRLCVDETGTHSDLEMIPAMVSFISDFMSSLERTTGKLPVERFEIDGADSIRHAIPWLTASALMLKDHNDRSRRRRWRLVVLGTIAVSMSFLFIRRWARGS